MSTYISEQESLLEWHQHCGYNPHSLGSILPGARAWNDPKANGMVSYYPVGNTWLANEPFAIESDLVEISRTFIEHAARERMLLTFIPATERFARLATELGLDAVPIGVSP